MAACKIGALRGKRIGIPRNVLHAYLNTSSAVEIASFNDALKVLEAAGAILIDNTNFTGVGLDVKSKQTVLDADFTSGIAAYFAQLTINPNNLH